MLPAIICLPLMIAAGSALFHASPSHLTHMLDIIPVAFFALCTVLLFIHLAGTNRARIATTMLGWIIATALAAQWPELLAHSLFYVPTAILLILLALPGNAVVDKAYLTTGDHALLSGVAVTFTMALVFRALDLTLCRLDISDGIIAEQYGTHWLWHLLTAASCALSMQLIIRMALRKSEHSYVR